MVAFIWKIEDAALEYFEGIVKDDNITINMEVPQKLETLQDYLEGWRTKIWEQGFSSQLKGASYFKKSDSFMHTEGSNQAVRRFLFRFVFITLTLEFFESLLEFFYLNFVISKNM